MSNDRGVVSLVLAASFDKSNHRKQSAAKFWPIGGLLSSSDSTPLSILIAYLKISNLSLLAVAQLIIPASPSLFLLQNDVSKKRKNDYKKPLRMVRGQTRFMFYEVAKSAGGLGTRIFHRTTTIQQQLYWQKLCATHKNKISCGESSQIDGLQAGKITFKDYHLICLAKVGFTHFLTTNKLESS